MPRLAVIGFGALGTAIISGNVNAAAMRAEDVLVIVRSPLKAVHAAKLGFESSTNIRDAAQCERLLLAVKPQSFSEVANQIGVVSQPILVVSVMAGITSARIESALGDRVRVVRAMPNTAVRISKGMTVLAGGSRATADDLAFSRALFSAVGEVLVSAERMLDAATAVSASGPAYLFFLAEAWIEAAQKAGFSPEEARQLVTQTVLGAAELLAQSEDTPQALRKMVTSPSGTTAAAIKVLTDRGLREAMLEAVAAATTRAGELAKA